MTDHASSYLIIHVLDNWYLPIAL